MINQLFSLVVFILLSLYALGQGSSNNSFAYKNKYLQFLSEQGPNAQARILSASYQYLYSPWGKTFKTGGFHLSLGLNLARFFSNKFIFGVFIDVKGIKGFTQQKFSSEFVSDFNNNFKYNFSNSSDSAKAYTVKDAINKTNYHGFHGNYYGNIGIMFSPFPAKYGGILLCIKKGYRSYPVYGTYGNKFLRNREAEIVMLNLNKNYAFSLTFKPAILFFKPNTNLDELEGIDYWQFFSLGFYYEQLILSSAHFDSMRLDSMLDSGFINKYGTDHRFGISFGFSFY